MIKVSVIIPIYNVAAYLEECLDCVVNQTLQEMEIICMNDGSTDHSEKIVQDFARKDDRIIAVNKKNAGYGHSVNLGVRIAQGEYIGIVEPDDFLRLDMMEELYQIAHEMQLDVVKADFTIVRGPAGKRTYSRQKICKSYDLYRRVTNADKEPDIFHASLFTWAGIYRRKFLSDHGIWHNETPGASFQDNGFWFQVFVKAQSVYFVDKAYYYLRRDNPDSSIKSTKKVYCICEEYDFIRRRLLEEKEERYLPVQWYWRWKGYLGTLTRIGAGYKEAFLERFRADFLQGLQTGELYPEMFAEDQKLLAYVLDGDFAQIYQELFLDRELLGRLRRAGKIILYGEEENVRDICKRLDQYHDPQIHLAGVALLNHRTTGVVWDQRICTMERLAEDVRTADAGGAAVLIAAADEQGDIRQMLQGMGFTQFFAMPDYIKGVRHV